MKRLTVSAARYSEMKREGFDNSDRAAVRFGSGLNFDATIQFWPSRAAMAKTVRMQQKRAPHFTDWKPVVELQPGEGH